MAESVNWDYVPQSEPRIVSILIKERSQQDSSFYPLRTNTDVFTSAGIPDISENVICTYADLDKLIEKAELSNGERRVVNLLMEGYSLSDIAAENNGDPRAYRVMFQRAVKKIVHEHNENWCYVMNHQLARR